MKPNFMPEPHVIYLYKEENLFSPSPRKKNLCGLPRKGNLLQ